MYHVWEHNRNAYLIADLIATTQLSATLLQALQLPSLHDDAAIKWTQYLLRCIKRKCGKFVQMDYSFNDEKKKKCTA